jgi:PAS domain S-box-containing protein
MAHPAPGADDGPMRQRVGVSAVVAAVAVVLVLVWLIDLGLTSSSSGARSSTTLLHVLPVVEVVLLAASFVAIGWFWTRSRQVRHEAAAHAAAAQEEADRLLKVIDNTSAVIYMRDGAGRYLLVNRQYEELFGIRRDEIVGLTDHDLFPPEMADAFRANDIKAMAHGAPIQMEEVAPHADGLHTYITVKYPIADATGHQTAICGISTDITPLKHAEQKERELNAELEERVRERTADLEASTRELDTFAYSVSHDLRAPLRAITGFSEVLLEDHSHQLDATGQEHLGRVVAATERMGHLIDDLLDLSRASRVELDLRRVDLTALAYRVAGDVRAVGPAHADEVDVCIDEGLSVVGDPVLLELMMLNLISNAWKFTAKVPKPRIHFGSIGQAGSLVYLVQDNGAGFDMRYADKLFAPFQRLHNREDFPGSGIGLAIVGRIVARHGGRVWAEGEPGEGATFYFTLPRTHGFPPAGVRADARAEAQTDVQSDVQTGAQPEAQPVSDSGKSPS